MVPNQSYRIRVEAAKALAEWKAFFADQVAVHARELAKCGSKPELVTLEHYRQAAILAVQALAIEVQNAGSIDERQKAA